MSIVSNNSWQSYRVGAVITVNGADWKIERVETRETDKGRQTRLFHLRGPDGETCVKTSRGISLWVSGHANQPAPVSTVVNDDDAVVEAVRDHYTGGGGKSLAEVIAEAVAATGLVSGRADTAGVDRDEVVGLINERLQSALLPHRVEVVTYDGVIRDVGVQHVQFEALLAAVACRRNLWLVGPAGSGKTSSAHAVAESLGLKFYAKSVGPQTSESSLLGYYDANGKCVRTQLREAFEFGGVFLLDEVDAANPAVLVVINQLLANGHASFPDAVVEKHPDFVLIAGANTIGQGADRQYVGRQQIDAATLDRFVLLDWPYDPRIEAAAAGVSVELFAAAPVPQGIKVTPVKTDVEKAVAEDRVATYVKKVVAIRNAIASLGKGVRVIVSPRASINGAALLRAGWPIDAVLDGCVWKGLDKDTRSKIEANVA